MNVKHQRFCEEFIIDLNGKQAAIRTGYSELRAAATAADLLTRKDVQDYITQLKKDRSERTEITADMVIKELAKLGFSDIKEYYESENKTIDVTKLENRLSAAISSIKITETEGDWGSKTVKEFKLHDKLSALDKIGKHLGIFEKDNKQKAVENGGLQLVINKTVTRDVKDLNKPK
jgi:phage terminase small subunit